MTENLFHGSVLPITATMLVFASIPVAVVTAFTCQRKKVLAKASVQGGVQMGEVADFRQFDVDYDDRFPQL